MELDREILWASMAFEAEVAGCRTEQDVELRRHSAPATLGDW